MNIHLFLICFCITSSTIAQEQIKKKDSKLSRFGGDISVSTNRFSYYNTETSSMRNAINVAPCIRLRYTFGYTSATLGLAYNTNEKARNISYMSDYSYSIIRSKYLPNTFAYGYQNYDQNKYKNNFEQMVETLLRGTCFVKYYIKVPDKLDELVKIDSTSTLRPSIQVGYSVKYCDSTGKTIGGLFSGKPIFQTDLQYVVYRNWFVYAAVVCYLNKGTRQSWDSDFYYGFGLNQYAPFTFRVGYGNYYGNKFPWNSKKESITDILNGVITIAFNYSF